MKKQLWKNILMYCLVISLVLSNCSTTSIFAATTNDTKRNASSEATEPIDDAKECSGSGTLESPYIIKNAVQLSSIANNLTAYYQLGCDVDLSGNTWTPVGTLNNPFKGHIDGAGYSISNFSISVSTDYVGFFGYISDAEISNLTLKECNIKGRNYVAGLAAYASGTNTKIVNCNIENATIEGEYLVGGYIAQANNKFTISKCSCSSNINSQSGNVGGFVGNGSINMEQCLFTGKVNVTRGACVGGLVGYCSEGTFEQCYSNGEIEGSSNVAGLLGDNYYSNITISNCYVLGKLTATKNGYSDASVSGLFGRSYRDVKVINSYCAAKMSGINCYGITNTTSYISTITNSYYDAQVTGAENKSADDTERLTASMVKKTNYKNWDFDTVWDLEEGKSYPYLRELKKPENIYADVEDASGDGTEESPFLIYNAKQLEAIRYSSGSWFSLQNDIDLKGIEWKPVGIEKNPFRGHLLGNGYKISNFTIKSDDKTTYIGFFGYMSNAEIRDLTISEFSISGKNLIGGLAAYAYGTNTKIINCNIYNATISGESNVGGFFGQAKDRFTISGCSCNSNITAKSSSTSGYTSYAGGFVGYGSINMEKCIFAGKVNVERGANVGGLVGYCSEGTFEQCYSTGEIEGSTNVAGLLGDNNSSNVTISNCYVLGKLTATKNGYSDGNVSGLFGRSYRDVKVTNSYCAAKMSGTNCYGITNTTNYISTITNSYYDAQVTGAENKSTDDTERLTASMVKKTNFKNWDFDTVWDMEEGKSYPYLRQLEKPSEVDQINLTIKGSGTQEDPYIITNEEEMQILRYQPSAWFILGNDINLQGHTWNPVGSEIRPFSGHLNGDGYKVYNYSIEKNTNYSGIFAFIRNAEIKNIVLSDFDIKGGSYIGGLVGRVSGSESVLTNCHIKNATINGEYSIGSLIGFAQEGFTLTKCTSNAEIISSSGTVGGLIGLGSGSMTECAFTGKMEVEGYYVGGLIGDCYVGKFARCYSAADIKGTDLVGGLMGYSNGDETEIENCFVVGTLECDDSYRIGGLISGGTENLKITNCYCAASLKGTHRNGIGLQTATIQNSYYDAQKNDLVNETSYDTDRLTAALTAKDNFVNWDFDNVWEISEGRSYPYLKGMAKPSLVTVDKIDIQGIGMESNPYKITNKNQLQLMNYHLAGWYEVTNDINLLGETWKPIAKKTAPFRGTLDGGENTISNLNLTSENDNVGFFEATQNANIRNLNLADISISGKDYVGGLIAYGDGNKSKLENCHLTRATINGNSYVGGIAGSYCGTMYKCNFSGDVNASGDYTGGLAGYVNDAKFEESYSSATLEGKNYIGGLVGGTSSLALNVLNSYATGFIFGENYLGGIIGHSGGNITLKNVYAATQMDDSENRGGIVGDNAAINATNIYYDKKVSRLDAADWGKTTDEMLYKKQFTDWNFESVWKIEEGKSYPYLLDVEDPKDVMLYTATGNIIDASTSEGISFAKVNVKLGQGDKARAINKEVLVDDAGTMTIDNLTNKPYTLEISAVGYETKYINLTCTEETYSLGTIKLTRDISENTYRVKLTWGENPKDLDANVRGGDQKIYCAREGRIGTGVVLDKDVRDGFGPEIVIIQCNKLPEGKYRYYVVNQNGDTTWSVSNAKVEIFRGTKLLYTVTPPTTLANQTKDWQVFDLDSKTGEITILTEEDNTNIDWDDKTDSDNDDMPDVYEKYCYETDPLNPDTDGDSLPDGFEIKISYTDPLSKDTDENGIPDNQEDPDSDKLTNYEEYIEKTDPLKPDTDEDDLLDGDEVHEYHTDPLKPDTDDDHVEDGDEILLQTNPNDNTDGDTIVTQSMSEDELDVNDDNDDFKISLKLEVSNNLKKYIKQNESLYTGMLSDNRSIIAYPVYIGYEAGEVKSGTISFRLSDNLLTKRPHYYKDLNLGIERYGIFTYDKKLRTIVPVPCSYNNDTITVDAKYMGDLIVMDYESLMYDNGIVPGASQDDPEMRQVDLVLVVDTTGSMGGQISAVKKNLSQIISKLREDGISLYVSIVDYRDITCDGEDSTKVNNNSGIDFYNSSSDISAVINSLSVGNGGDEPECTIDALGKALYLDYRNGASKYAFVITDASYKIDNNFEIKNMEEVAQSLEARGVITSVITSTSLYDCYNELTTITGGENISIDGDFCDDMYEVIYSKTAKTSVFLGNNIVSGSFKEPLVYGGSCDTDEDTISDSDEIDWDNVKQINADGTFELYTWGEMYARSSMADAEAVNPLFNYVSKIHVLPAISNPFSADSDNDYYPDDVDDNCFEEDDMYIEDDVLDDSHLHDDEEMDDSEEEINDFEEEMSVELCALKAKSNEIKISDGKIKQPKGGEANSLLFTRKIRKGKSDKFSLTPTKRSYYRFNVAGAESYKIKVTYTTGILCFKKTHTEKKQSDGTYLLQPERKYQITIKCEGKGNYIFSIRKDNWVYAPNGGVVSEPYMDFGGNSVLHDYTSVYIPEKTIQKICSIINFSEKNDKDFKEVFIRNMECRFFTSKSENKIKAEVKKASDSVSIATTFAGVVLMFVPEAKVLGIVTTSIGGVTTATSLMLTKSTSRLDEFSSTLRRAISKNNYNICVTSSRYGNLFSSTSLECSSWKNRYIYKFNPLGKPWNVKVGVTPKDVSKAFK